MPTLTDLPAYLPEGYFPEERSDAARNRLTIINHAHSMLETITIQELKMSDLAVAAGVGKGTLYRRFENKGALAKALVIDDFLALQRELMQKNEQGMEAESLLLWFVKALTRFNMAHAELISATIMKEDMPADWWLESGVMVWLKDILAAIYVSAAPGRDGDWFASSIIPAIMLVSPKSSKAKNKREEQRIEWLVNALLKA